MSLPESAGLSAGAGRASRSTPASRLDGTCERSARRLCLDRFGCDATIVSDLEQPASREVHGGEGCLLQADAFKPSKLPQFFVHASALDVPGPCGAETA